MKKIKLCKKCKKPIWYNKEHPNKIYLVDHKEPNDYEYCICWYKVEC